MKQQISNERVYKELSKKAQKKLIEWWKPKISIMSFRIASGEIECPIPTMNIGMMIEFLMEHEYFEENSDLIGEPPHTVCNLNWEFNEELCDALWEAVKEELT